MLLQVHAKGKKLSKDVDYEKIARRTPGFTGADLQARSLALTVMRCTRSPLYRTARDALLLHASGTRIRQSPLL